MGWQDNGDGTYSKIAEVERLTIEQIQGKIDSVDEQIESLNTYKSELQADLAAIQALGE